MTLIRRLIAVLACAFACTARAEDLNLFAWSEYVPQTVLDGFKKETGIRVRYESYASNEEMLSKLLEGGGRYDLVQPSEYAVEALIKGGKLLPLDHAKLPNLANLDPLFTKQAYDPGNAYSVPYMSGTVGIVYNAQKVNDPIRGFGDVFGGKYAGRIVSLDDGREITSWVLATLGKDANDMSDANLALAKPTMAKWLKQIKIYDSDSPKTYLLAGDVDVGVVWSGEGAILVNQKPETFKWVVPSEGTHRFIDTLAIPKTARHAEAAYKFLNYVLRPEVSKQISDAFPYTNPNAAARKLLDKKALANPASYPPDDAKLDIFHDLGKRSAAVDELYTNVKSR